MGRRFGERNSCECERGSLLSRGSSAASLIAVLFVVTVCGQALGVNRDIADLETEVLSGRTMTVAAPGGGTQTVPMTAVKGEVVVTAKPGVTEGQMQAAAAARGCEVIKRIHGCNLYVIALPDGQGVLQGAASWDAAPEAKAADPNFISYPMVVPNDPLYTQQWHWENISAPNAWDVDQGDASTIVAIVDSGIDYNHPDLQSRAWINQAEAAGAAGADDDGNGFVDDIYGWDFYNSTSDPAPYAGAVADGHAHGTHVAGLVGADSNNGVGVAGHDWNCRLMAVQVFGPVGGSPDSLIMEGFNYAVDNGADIINLSLGGWYSEAWSDPIERAVQLGVLVVASAGNDSVVMTDDQSTWGSPVCNDGPFFTDNWVLGVGSVGDDDTVAYYSNLDASSRSFVDVMAPGGDVIFNRQLLSTFPDAPAAGFTSPYDLMQGTSQAAPVAAGLAAIVLSRFPTLTPPEIIQQIGLSCDNIDGVNPGHVGQMGMGRINSGNSLIDMPPRAPRSISAFDTPGDEGGSVTVTWSKSLDDGRGFDDVTGYDVARSDNSDAGPFTVVEPMLSAGTTTYEDTDVIDGTSYWYKVIVHDASSTAETSVAGPAIPIDDLPPDPIENLFVNDTVGDNGGSVTLNWSGYSAPSDFQDYRVYRSESEFTSINDDGVELLQTIAQVTAQVAVDQTAQDGTEYWYAVTARDDIPNENPAVTAVGPIVSSPNFTFTYAPGLSLMSVGAITQEKDLAAVLGVPPASLAAARWNPTTAGYERYQSNPNSPFLQHALGRAFWLNTTDPLMRSVAGQPAPEGAYPIAVIPGWNMIGNPYTTNLDVTGATVTVGGETETLADAADRGWVRDYMWSYDTFLQSYVLVSPSISWAETAIRKGRGVFMRSFVNATVELPRPGDAAVPAASGAGEAEAITADWQIRLVAQTDGAADVDNFVGVSSAAVKLNAVASPPPQGVDLYFENEPGVRSAAAFSRPGAANVTKNFKVQSAQTGPVSISWPDLSALPGEYRPFLVDAAGGKTIYMRTVKAYSFEAQAGAVRSLSIELRPAAQGALVVSSMSAAATRGGAQIAFALNKDAEVSVDILNIAGRTVRSLSGGVVAGDGQTMTLAWDGRNASGAKAPGGRYLIRVTATANDGQAASAMSTLNLGG